MKFGVCIGGDKSKIAPAKEFGFDYVESCFDMLVNDNDGEREAFIEELKKTGIPCLCVNCFVPGKLKVCGDSVDYDALSAHVSKGFSRCADFGVKTVVFGSGGARSIPEGFSYVKGAEQIGFFLKTVVAPLAEQYEINVVIEPLADCNIITTVKEGAMISVMGESENIAVLADGYHMYYAGDTNDNVRALKGYLKHSHIANPLERDGEKRGYPLSAEEYDYKSFIDALSDAGCETCSIEGRTDDWMKEAEIACGVLKSLI